MARTLVINDSLRIMKVTKGESIFKSTKEYGQHLLIVVHPDNSEETHIYAQIDAHYHPGKSTLFSKGEPQFRALNGEEILKRTREIQKVVNALAGKGYVVDTSQLALFMSQKIFTLILTAK